MLVLIAQDFSECTYSVCVCVFRVASGDKIQRNVQWLACESCLSLLFMLLNGKTAVENKWDYLRCYSHQQNDDSENKYISLYIYVVMCK